MKARSLNKKSQLQDNYNGIPITDIWNMDVVLARLLANHLRAFLKVEKSSEGGIPGIIANKIEGEKAKAVWLNIIRKMIYSFEMYQHNFNDIDNETKSRIREGMQLFMDYFRYLWI